MTYDKHIKTWVPSIIVISNYLIYMFVKPRTQLLYIIYSQSIWCMLHVNTVKNVRVKALRKAQVEEEM